MNNNIDDQIEDSVLKFLKKEALGGSLESTTREIANGAKLVYNQVGKALERLRIRGQVGYRERGTERKSVRYYYLSDIVKLYRKYCKV